MILEVKDGCFGYFGQPVIFDHINLSLEKGHILAVLGPNGIGKTTLLKCMIGLLPWKRGQTLLNGQNIVKMKPADIWKTVSYIPQSHGFAFSYTGLEMVMLGRSSHMGTFQQPGAREIEMAERMMEKVGITRLAYKDCNRMSGGELQMVLIARALINEPQLITHYPTNAMSVSDEAFMMNHKGRFFYGATREVLTEENISQSFDVRVLVSDLVDNGRHVRSIVPVALTAN